MFTKPFTHDQAEAFATCGSLLLFVIGVMIALRYVGAGDDKNGATAFRTMFMLGMSVPGALLYYGLASCLKANIR